MTINIRRGVSVKPPIALLYGLDKVGKSGFAAGIDYDKDGQEVGRVEGHNPLFISTGEELESMGVDRTDPCRTTEEIHNALVFAAEDTEHNLIAVDHLSDVERFIHAEVAAGWDPPAKSIGDIGYGKGYITAFRYWEALWTDIERVRASGKAVVLIAHSKVVRFEPPDGEGYDTFQPEIHTNAKGEGAGTFLRKKVDVIAFAHKETFTRSVEVGFKKTIQKGIDGGRRRLRLVGTPAIVAGNRYGMPEVIDLSWRAFIDAFTEATSRARGAAE